MRSTMAWNVLRAVGLFAGVLFVSDWLAVVQETASPSRTKPKGTNISNGALKATKIYDLDTLNFNDAREDEFHSGVSGSHCVVHIHGFHHSGTGFLRATIHGGFNSTSAIHEHTGKPEDEGQHLEDVYPSFSRRKRNKVCLHGNDTSKFHKYGRLYYCPELLQIAEDPQNHQKLFAQWSRYWNMTQQILLQKTPTFDILLLERMKVGKTVHTIIMRHPFDWHNGFMDGRLIVTPYVWLDTWAHTLEVLHSGEIESYVVVNYETLALNQPEVSNLVVSFVSHGCGLHESRVARKLNLRKGHNIFEYMKHTSKALRVWQQCEEDKSCFELMNDLAPVMVELGYTWDREASFLPPEIVDQPGVLFSSQKPPSLDLVQKLQALAEKHCRN